MFTESFVTELLYKFYFRFRFIALIWENKDSLSHAVDFESDRADGYRALEAQEQSRGGRRGSRPKQPKVKKPSFPDGDTCLL